MSVFNGQNFERYKQTPVLDRADEGLYIRAIHSVLYEDSKFKVWYATGNGWESIDGTDYPQYDINYIESLDGINFPESGIKCIVNDPGNQEYRIGRPRVYKQSDAYLMNYTYGTLDGRYKAGLARSRNGINWIRGDHDLGIDLSESGWDSKHLSYPSVITSPNNKTYMFYNGNEMGLHGFGYAELLGHQHG